MKTERAIELLHRLQDEQFDGIHGDERREALEMAVRALEQNLVKESGGLVKDLVKDCISRKMAIDQLHQSYNLLDAEQRLEDLPSAQPQRKRGKWIPVDSFSAFGGDEAMWMAHGNPVAFYYCSECKEQAYAGEDGESLLTDFCPSCGADMRTEGNDDN